MQLDDSYEPVEQALRDGVVVSKMRDTRSGKLIQIHRYLPEKAQEANEICRRLLSLPDEAQRKILKYDKDGASTYFMTELLPDGVDLISWVGDQSAARRPAGKPELSAGTAESLRNVDITPAPLQPLPARDTEPGDFTRLYSEAAIHASIPEQPRREPVPQTPAVSQSERLFNDIYVGNSRTPQVSLPDSGVSHTEPAPAGGKHAGQDPPGLLTFIGVKSDVLGAPRVPEPSPSPVFTPPHPAPPAPLPVQPAPPNPEPSPWQARRVILPRPGPPGEAPVPQGHQWEAPPPAPPLPKPWRSSTNPELEAAPRRAAPGSSGLIDWRIVLLTGAIMLAGAGIVILLVETATST